VLRGGALIADDRMIPPIGGRGAAVIRLGKLVMILDLHRQGLSVSTIFQQLVYRL
jgi:hypothetical protein